MNAEDVWTGMRVRLVNTSKVKEAARGMGATVVEYWGVGKENRDVWLIQLDEAVVLDEDGPERAYLRAWGDHMESDFKDPRNVEAFLAAEVTA